MSTVRNWIKTPKDVNLLMRFVILFVCFLAYSPGFWKIVAKFSGSPQMHFTAEFEVKKYGKYNIRQTAAITSSSNWWFLFLNSSVMPALSVKLTPQTTFFYVDGTKLTVNIEAKCVKVFWFYGFNWTSSGIKVKPFYSSLPSGICSGQRLTEWHSFYLEFNTEAKKRLFQVPSSEYRWEIS